MARPGAEISEGAAVPDTDQRPTARLDRALARAEIAPRCTGITAEGQAMASGAAEPPPPPGWHRAREGEPPPWLRMMTTHDYHSSASPEAIIGDLRETAQIVGQTLDATLDAYLASCELAGRAITPDELGLAPDTPAAAYFWGLHDEATAQIEQRTAALSTRIARAIRLAVLCAGCMGLWSVSDAKAQDLGGVDRVMRQGAAPTTACTRPERVFVTGPDGGKPVLGADSLVDAIRSETAARAVLNAGTCTCDMWMPPWDAAVAVYYEKYAGLSEAEVFTLADNIRTRARAEIDQARKLCLAEGWR